MAMRQLPVKLGMNLSTELKIFLPKKYIKFFVWRGFWTSYYKYDSS